MNIVRLFVNAALVASLSLSSAFAADEARRVNWEDLVPDMGLGVPKTLDLDGDGTVTDYEMSKAPSGQSDMDETVPELNGKLVKIPAFVVPLDGDMEALTELLLVPYFGACIHVPPPPPNQIIHIKPEGEGVKIGDLDLYDPVFAIGVLRTDGVDHELAEIGYSMDIKKLEPYTED